MPAPGGIGRRAGAFDPLSCLSSCTAQICQEMIAGALRAASRGCAGPATPSGCRPRCPPWRHTRRARPALAVGLR
eukprot:215010-Pyramimonas_sp.AAC.1